MHDMLGITLRGANGLGDKLQFSSFPENYYRNTGEKVIDIDSIWIFDHNPFVIRGSRPTRVIDLWSYPWPQRAGVSPQQFVAKPIFSSIAERTAGIFDHVVYLRHPRLYAYEHLAKLERRVILHTTGQTFQPRMGEDQPKVLSEEIIDHVRTKYHNRNYEVIQVGSSQDRDAHVIDCRGIDNIWDTVRLISQAGIFIGVDSGPSWVAASYRGIFAKKILMQYSPDFLRSSFVPMHLMIPHQHWYDASFIYFNRSQDDAGITYSYLKV